MFGEKITSDMFVLRRPSPVVCRQGFTLVEMSIVLVVIGLIIMAVLPSLTAARAASQRSLTQANLQALMLATAAYAQANGCLPCPAPAATSGPGFGRVRGDAGVTPPPCGVCAMAFPRSSTASSGFFLWPSSFIFISSGAGTRPRFVTGRK